MSDNVFYNCNVCGRRLSGEDEHEMGMCCGCADLDYDTRSDSMPQPDCFITARCDNGHEQVTQVAGLGLEWATRMAELLDGSSDLYRYPPDEKSVIGKCGICGAKITCEVNEAEQDKKEDR